jgi:hypothetical protein
MMRVQRNTGNNPPSPPPPVGSCVTSRRLQSAAVSPLPSACPVPASDAAHTRHSHAILISCLSIARSARASSHTQLSAARKRGSPFPPSTLPLPPRHFWRRRGASARWRVFTRRLRVPRWTTRDPARKGGGRKSLFPPSRLLVVPPFFFFTLCVIPSGGSFHDPRPINFLRRNDIIIVAVAEAERRQ